MSKNAINDLYKLVADIGCTEITDQIKNDNLSAWCNTWRITAKACLRIIKKEC